MKKYILFIILVSLSACSDKNESENFSVETFLNVSYGSDSQQIMDVYLPANRNSNTTKVLILVHGGGWSGGSKSDFTSAVPGLQTAFPDYAIVNIGYRLATVESPGYPKQINDIQQVIQFLKSSDYQVSNQYAFIGTSAGAHLSMLYSYKYDTAHEVKTVCSIVGPTDFTDPSYVGNPLFTDGLSYLVGDVSYEDNPELYAEVSPITHVSAQSPPTIQFMGNADPLIPATQGPRLEAKLDDFNVDNELHIYNAGHGDFNAVDAQEINLLFVAFLTAHF